MPSSSLAVTEALPAEIRTWHHDITAALSALYQATVNEAAAAWELAQATAEVEQEIRKRITAKQEKATESSIKAEVTLDPRVIGLTLDAEQAHNVLLRAKLDLERLDATRRMLSWLVNLSLASVHPTDLDTSP